VYNASHVLVPSKALDSAHGLIYVAGGPGNAIAVHKTRGRLLHTIQ
jgi:hypothetical protein